jgi:hypothetical protein
VEATTEAIKAFEAHGTCSTSTCGQTRAVRDGAARAAKNERSIYRIRSSFVVCKLSDRARERHSDPRRSRGPAGAFVPAAATLAFSPTSSCVCAAPLDFRGAAQHELSRRESFAPAVEFVYRAREELVLRY